MYIVSKCIHYKYEWADFQNVFPQDPALKHMAQKAFVSYLRSVHLQSNKSVFDINKYSAEGLAGSWGLATMPRIRFVDVPDQKMKNIPYALREDGGGKGDKGAVAWRAAEGGGVEGEEIAEKKARAEEKMLRKKEKSRAKGGSDSEEEEEEEAPAQSKGGERRAIATTMPMSKMSKLFNRKNNDVLSETYRKMVQHDVRIFLCGWVGVMGALRVHVFTHEYVHKHIHMTACLKPAPHMCLCAYYQRACVMTRDNPRR